MSLKDLSLREKVYRTIIIRDFQINPDGTLKEFFEKYPVELFLPGEDWKTEDSCKGKLWRCFHPVPHDT